MERFVEGEVGEYEGTLTVQGNTRYSKTRTQDTLTGKTSLVSKSIEGTQKTDKEGLLNKRRERRGVPVVTLVGHWWYNGERGRVVVVHLGGGSWREKVTWRVHVDT